MTRENMPESTEKDMSSIQNAIPLLRSPNLILILDTPKGRGVFASIDLPARTILEVSPVLVLDPNENEQHIRKTDLYNYTYNWPYTPSAPPISRSSSQATLNQQTSAAAATTTQAIILGLGSMFNHSSLHQNVGWTRDLQNLTITYSTLREVKKGEELCISYGDRLTFVDADLEERKRVEEREIEGEQKRWFGGGGDFEDGETEGGELLNTAT